MNNKWIDSVIDNFINGNKLNGTLTDRQFNSFSKHMKRTEIKGYYGITTTYSYYHNDYTFKVWNNKFSITNEKQFHSEKQQRELNEAKRRLQSAIEAGDIAKIEKYREKIFNFNI